MIDEDLNKALKKKAVGYTNEEIVEEYSSNEGELTLTKRKVTTKYVPPDVSAIKALSELCNDNSLEDMTDEELLKEKERLLSML